MKTKLALAVSAALVASAANAQVSTFNQQELTLAPSLVGASEGLKARQSVSKQKFVYEHDLAQGEYTYIVRLTDAPVASYQGELPSLEATSAFSSKNKSQKISKSSPAVKSYVSYLQSKQKQFSLKAATLGVRNGASHTYKYAFNGMALKMTQQQAHKLSELSEVISIEREAMYQLDTDVSQELIGSPKVWDGTATGSEAKGAGVIVGVIDSGINTDHPSFADIGGDDYDHTNPWGQGVYVGDCAGEFSDLCNDKLIGVRSYASVTDNYDDASVFGDTPPAKNGEDYGGHGSHTASTAAGNVLKNVTYVTRDSGKVQSDGVETDIVFEQISGVAPHANIVAYQICNPGNSGDKYSGCPGAAIIAALDDAIADEVDVINYSISGGGFPWSSSTELAFLEARNAGIFAAVSAGNTSANVSQTPSSSSKHAPWYTSVAASTHTRQISATVSAGDSDFAYQTSSGPAFEEAITGMLLYAGDVDADNFEGCDAFEADAFAGKIALIKRGACSFAQKIDNAAAAGATAVIIFNRDGTGNAGVGIGGAEDTTIPSIGIGNRDGLAIVSQLAENAELSVTFNTDLKPSEREADVLASFSLLGPNGSVDVVAPSISGPGVDVYAAYADEQYGHEVTGTDPSDFTLLSGTSMSAPHLAGSGALLKSAHPTWTPDNIRSALMLTATTAQAMKKADEVTVADAFDVGAGRVRVDLAAKAGLIMDETADNYANANPRIGGDPRTLNTPSMADSKCVNACSWKRTVTATAEGTWTTSGQGILDGMTVTVSPEEFTLAAGESMTLTIEADISNTEVEAWQFGNVILTSDAHPTSTMPVAVKAARSNLPNQFTIDAKRNKDTANFYDLKSLDLTGLSVKLSALGIEQSYNGSVSQDSDNSRITDDLFDGTHLFDIDVPAGSSLFTARITAATSPDLDLWILADTDRDGALDTIVDTSLTGGSLESVSISDPADGVYVILVQNYQASSADAQDTFTMKHNLVSSESNESFAATLTGDNSDFDLSLAWDANLVQGDVANAVVTFSSDSDDVADVKVPVQLTRSADDVVLPALGAIAPNAPAGDMTTFTASVTANLSNTDKTYTVTAKVPAGHELLNISEGGVEVTTEKQVVIASSVTEVGDVLVADKTISWTVDMPAGASAKDVSFDLIPRKAGEDYTLTLTQNVNSANAEVVERSYTFSVEEVAPKAMIAVPSTVVEGSDFQISGSGSYDLNADELTYNWVQRAGSKIDFDSSSANLSVVAPKVSGQDEVFTFELTVTDANGNSNTTTESFDVSNKKKKGGSLGWLALLLTPLAMLRRKKA